MLQPEHEAAHHSEPGQLADGVELQAADARLPLRRPQGATRVAGSTPSGDTVNTARDTSIRDTRGGVPSMGVAVPSVVVGVPTALSNVQLFPHS